MTKPNELPDDALLHLKDTHVGSPTEKLPLTDADWINFARAVLAASMASQATAELPKLPEPAIVSSQTDSILRVTTVRSFSHDQMDEYGAACYEAGRASRAQSEPEGMDLLREARDAIGYRLLDDTFGHEWVEKLRGLLGETK